MMQQPEIKLTLDLVNAILGALGKCSYQDVFQIVNEIHTQAVPQLPKEEPKEEEKVAE